jgi:IS1 family transposase
MNKLPNAVRTQILNLLVEGMSMRSVSRVTGVSINTVSKLLIDAGKACIDFHDKHVISVKSQSVQCDEIWSFCYAKDKNVKAAVAAPEGAGDVWTWTAIDSDSKLMISWLVGSRDSSAAVNFLRDLKYRLANSVQITTDGHGAYLEAMKVAFGNEVDYAMLIKLFGPSGESKHARYSPPSVIGTKTKVISGDPDLTKVNTSFAERQNLTMRMSMRRYTRLTNAFSKKFENHCHALALYFFHYNFLRLHKTLRVTPAMAAGISKELLSWETIIELVDQAEQKALVAKRWEKLKMPAAS